MKRSMLISAFILLATPLISWALDAYPTTSLCELFTAVG